MEEVRSSAYRADGLFTVEKGLALPLRLVVRLSGDAGLGPSAPSVMPSSAGILVSRRGCIGLYSADLSTEIWRQTGSGWCNVGFRAGRHLVAGPLDGFVRRYEISNGCIQGEIPVASDAVGVVAVIGESVVLRQPDWVYAAIEWSGALRWQRYFDGTLMASTPSRLFITEDFDRRLQCVDADSGEAVWSFEAPVKGAGEMAARGVRISRGFRGVVVVQERVLVTVGDGRQFALALGTGEVLSVGTLGGADAFVVTQTSIFLKSAFLIREVDHASMQEVGRLEYRQEVEPLYGREAPSVRAFWLTEDSVLWTTPHGALMGVDRRAAPDHRTIWSQMIPNALMPFAEPPIGSGAYLYLTAKGESPALYCFKSIEPRA